MKEKYIIIIFVLILVPSISPALEIPDNSRIEKWVIEYTTNRRIHFQKSLNRSSIYIETIKEVFREEGLPEQLSWLPFVESGFDCSATSRKDAAGCWQFMKETGSDFGLESNKWKDHRYDFRLSTIAAAKYLKKLYKRFGSWDLALSAYNLGPTTVKYAVNDTKSKNYWDLNLPRETMDYVPKFFAVLKIVENLEEYNFRVKKRDVDIVKLSKGPHSLARIAMVMKIDYDDLKEINPGYELGYTPPGEETEIYVLRGWDIDMLKWFGMLSKKNPATKEGK